MSSRWRVIAVVAAALALASEARAGNGGDEGKNSREECREEGPGGRADHPERGDWPRILRGDADSSSLFIHGTGFGTRNGTVTLGGQPLGIAAWSPTDIVAVLPKGLLPASYLLTVTPLRGRCVKAGFSVAVGLGMDGTPGPPGPVGPAGPQGPTGATGPAGPQG